MRFSHKLSFVSHGSLTGMPVPCFRKRVARTSGFALVVALMLMSFILLLVTGLSTFIQVEVVSSRHSQEQLTAQQNALLGLSTALGELQKTAGRDQRVTARADIRHSDAAHPLWTGVWRSEPPVAFTAIQPVPPLNAGFTTTPNNHLNESTLHFVNWLVSGNEGHPGGSDDPSFLPTGSLNAGLNGGSAHDAIYLVGPGTLIGPRSTVDPTSLSGSVAAPVVGLNNTQNRRSGHYAWWVGDEGVKAKVLPQSAPTIIGRTTAAGRVDRFKLPVANEPSAMNELTFFNRAANGLDRLHGFREMALPMNLDQAQQEALNERWHDLSLYSKGLLTDTRWGGFRGDLSHAFTYNSVFERYFNESDRTLFFVNPTQFGYSADFSNWDILRSYHNLYTRLDASGSTRMNMPIPVNSGLGVYAQGGTRPYRNTGNEAGEGYHKNSPVHSILARLQISVGIRFDEHEVEENGVVTSTIYRPVILIKPLTALYNPYNARLIPAVNASGTLLDQDLRWSFLPKITITVGDNDPVVFALREVLSRMLDSGESRAAWRDLWLRHPLEVFEAGETRIFSLWEDTDRLALEPSSVNGRVELRGGPADDAFSYDQGFLVLPLWDAWKAADGHEGVEANYQSASRPAFGLTDSEKARLEADDLDTLVEITIDSSAPGSLWSTFRGQRTEGTLAGNAHVQYFTNLTSSAAHSVIPRTFSVGSAIPNIGDQGNQAILMTWGMWLRTANEIYAQNRLLVDTNIRALTGVWGWDGLVDDDFYMISNFSGDIGGDQLYGYLEDDPLPGTMIADYDGFTATWGDGSAGRVVLFDIPRTPPVSLGAFQHAHVGRYIGDPTYVIGNSFVPARLRLPEHPYHAGFIDGNFDVWDLSWIFNQQLWDSYFLSGLTTTFSSNDLEALLDGSSRLPNHRLVLTKEANVTAAQLVDTSSGANTFYRNASRFKVDGAFNINSTSRDAWRAVLASSANLEIPVYQMVGGIGGISYETSEEAIFPRLQHPVHGAYTGGNNSGFWLGSRGLSQQEIDDLADAIVDELQDAEKPFASLAEFVNRPLEPSPNNGPGRPGLLQRAIERAGLNSSIGGGTVSDKSNPFNVQHNQYNDMPQATAFPGYLTQADILQQLAPILSARSDTFVIRSYGDAVNPVTGAVDAQAWCEAIVQRIPADIDGGELLARDADRAFRIISFRWLSKDEV
jgi:hypothetical protein